MYLKQSAIRLECTSVWLYSFQHFWIFVVKIPLGLILYLFYFVNLINYYNKKKNLPPRKTFTAPSASNFSSIKKVKHFAYTFYYFIYK